MTADLIWYELENEMNELENEMHAEIAEAVKPIEEAIRAKWEPVLEEARIRVADHRKNCIDSRYAEGLADALWRSGTKLVEWTNKRKNHYASYTTIPWERTGRGGVYEIYHKVNSEKTVPEPLQGDEIVRLSRKDGSPGARTVSWLRPEKWFPEDVHPDTYEHPWKKREADRKRIEL